MSHRASIASAVVGLILLLGPPVAWQALQPAETVGEVPAPEAVGPAPTPTSVDRVVVTPPPVAPEAERTPVARVPLEYAANPVSGPLGAVARPARVTIPAIDVDAEIDPVGRADDGAMQIPSDVARVGWYEPGDVRPGRNGTAVLAGHVDSQRQGHGAFFDLRHLDVDDEIVLGDADGRTTVWHVVGRTAYERDEIPVGDIFTRSGEPRLALITCGGPFDEADERYQHNIVVYAAPSG